MDAVIVLLILLFVLLAIGVPVGFAIGGATMISMFFFSDLNMVVNAQYCYSGIFSFTVMAIPYFMLAGTIMSTGGIARRIVDFASALIDFVTGALGCVSMLACMFFGAVSGSAPATVAAIGTIMIPQMVYDGYDKGYAVGLVCVAGGLGIIVPPSFPMVLYGVTNGVSIGDMFLAGFIPGILAELLLAVLSIVVAKRRKYQQVDVGVTNAREAISITLDAFLPLLMPVIILGGTMSGVCTATESAAVAVIYAFVLAKFVYREMTWNDLYRTLVNSAKSSASILFIISASTPFGWVLTLENVTTTVSNAVFAVVKSPILVYAAVVLILIILGTFMESFTIIILTTPIFLPIVTAIGVDPVAYGLVLMFCICIGGVTPPLAVCLFTACKIVKIRIEESIPDVFMVLGILLFVTILLMIFPQIALFLPSIAGT